GSDGTFPSQRRVLIYTCSFCVEPELPTLFNLEPMLHTLHPQPNLRLIQYLDGEETLPYHLLRPLTTHIAQLDQCILSVQAELTRNEEALACARMAVEETKMQLRELRTARSKYSHLEGSIPPPRLDILYPEVSLTDDRATRSSWAKRGNRDIPFMEHGARGSDKRFSKNLPLVRTKRRFDK
ncbi:hypothetical protein BKA70DRAFT_1520559, partial [Coprinopsis sp. MPI-PUGE-AT-0042]